MTTIKVLLVEDNRLLRDGATAILNKQEGIRAVSVGATNGDAISKARVFRPHVILLAMGLRNSNSVRVVHTVHKELPNIEVVVMDLIPAHADVEEFVKEGVSGFILKDATLKDFLETIRSVAKGVKVLPLPLTGPLFAQIVDHGLYSGNPENILQSDLVSRREQEVVDLIAQGKSNNQIADALFISVHTVKSHVHKILAELGLHTRLELAHLALKREKEKSHA